MYHAKLSRKQDPMYIQNPSQKGSWEKEINVMRTPQEPISDEHNKFCNIVRFANVNLPYKTKCNCEFIDLVRASVMQEMFEFARNMNSKGIKD